jgi:hypothetical protein
MNKEYEINNSKWHRWFQMLMSLLILWNTPIELHEWYLRFGKTAVEIGGVCNI